VLIVDDQGRTSLFATLPDQGIQVEHSVYLDGRNRLVAADVDGDSFEELIIHQTVDGRHHAAAIGLEGQEEPHLTEVEIDIKPGSFPNSINPGSAGTVPVAVLSSPGFDAPSRVDTSTLTFGRTGDENSLAFCSPSPEDVNGDGLHDLVCHFDTRSTGFRSGDTVGILRGRLLDGTAIEGRDFVRIVRGGGGRATAL